MKSMWFHGGGVTSYGRKGFLGEPRTPQVVMNLGGCDTDP